LGLLSGHAECGLVAVIDIQDHEIMGAEQALLYKLLDHGIMRSNCPLLVGK
jgi:hypothetical protein